MRIFWKSGRIIRGKFGREKLELLFSESTNLTEKDLPKIGDIGGDKQEGYSKQRGAWGRKNESRRGVRNGLKRCWGGGSWGGVGDFNSFCLTKMRTEGIEKPGMVVNSKQRVSRGGSKLQGGGPRRERTR